MKEMFTDNLPKTHLQPGCCEFVCTLESHLSERKVTLQSRCDERIEGFGLTCHDLYYITSIDRAETCDGLLDECM